MCAMCLLHKIIIEKKVLGWLEKKEDWLFGEESWKMNNSGFQPFQVGHLRASGQS